MKLMLDCRALVRLLSQSQDDMPPLAIRVSMRLHLITCRSCRNVDEQMRFVRTAMQAPEVTAPACVCPAKPSK